MNTSQKTAIVTGAAQGMGREFSERLARDGVHIVAVDIQDPWETVAAIEENGGKAIAKIADITDPAAVAGVIDFTEKELGGVDILVNNAAIHANPLTRVEDMSFELWRKTHSVNLDAVFLVTKAALPGMRSRGWGRIINISSSSLSAPIPHGMVHYVSTKGAVVGFTRALASEVGEHGITVNAVAPHGVLSPGSNDFPDNEAMHAAVLGAQSIKRLLVADDVSGAVAFLASEEARMITAQVLHVDAGVVRAG